MSRSPNVALFHFAPEVSRASALKAMSYLFADAGIDTPDLDARLLLCAVLNIDATALIMDPDRPLGAGANALATAANRRRLREPVSRILGVRDFYGRTFELSPATLDPRPDSETLIEVALAFIRDRRLSDKPVRILDVGTGSGCLLITLLAELPHASGVATDVSVGALEITARNATRHGVSTRLSCKIADALEECDEVFDLLVSNPPYIATNEIAQLGAEVRNYDPFTALDGGADGLDIYRRIIPRIYQVIPDGCAIFEIGHTQATAVVQLLREHARRQGWPSASVVKDLGGNARCVAQTTLRQS